MQRDGKPARAVVVVGNDRVHLRMVTDETEAYQFPRLPHDVEGVAAEE